MPKVNSFGAPKFLQLTEKTKLARGFKKKYYGWSDSNPESGELAEQFMGEGGFLR